MRLLISLTLLCLTTTAHGDLYFIERPSTYLPEGIPFAGDTGYFTYRSAPNQVRGYTSNTKTYLLEGYGVEDAQHTNKLVIDGTDGNLDSCGAWLKSIVPMPNGNLLGLYHGETDCNYNEQQSVMNTFFAVSTDNGQTFNSINNGLFDTVIEPGDNIHGNGNASMVLDGDTLHIYYVNMDGPWKTRYATVNINQLDQVNIVGEFDDRRVGSQVSWRGDTLSAMKVDTCRNFEDYSETHLANNCPSSGIRLSYSDDFINFEVLDFPLVYVPNVQRRDRASTEIIGSVSAVPFVGGGRWHNGFYLHYSYSHVGKPYSERRMVRRPVRIVSSDVSAGLSRLSTYIKGNTTWTTTNIPTKDFTFVRDEPAYLWTSRVEDNMIPLYEYYAPSLDSHLLKHWGTGSGAGQLMRVSGWIKRSPGPNTIPLYRVFKNGKHSLSVENEGVLLGYGYAG